MEERAGFQVAHPSQHLGVDYVSCPGILLVFWKKNLDIITAHCRQRRWASEGQSQIDLARWSRMRSGQGTGAVLVGMRGLHPSIQVVKA